MVCVIATAFVFGSASVVNIIFVFSQLHTITSEGPYSSKRLVPILILHVSNFLAYLILPKRITSCSRKKRKQYHWILCNLRASFDNWSYASRRNKVIRYWRLWRPKFKLYHIISLSYAMINVSSPMILFKFDSIAELTWLLYTDQCN